MSDESKPDPEDRRKGLSVHSLTFGGVIAVAGLVASGIATYNSLQNDIATLKRGEVYQEQVNKQIREEAKDSRQEQRETMKEFNEKLDRIIDHWPNRR